MTYYKYSRVSTNTQDSSTQQQDQLLTQFCERKEFLNAIDLVDTDVSGSKPILERPAGSKLAEVKKGDVIICAKHDRMFRSLRDAVNTISYWFEEGISVYLLNLGEMPIDFKNPYAKVTLYTMMMMAELEKDLISERTIKNLKFRKENGKTYSSAPYGYDNFGDKGSNGKIVNGKLIPNEAEQKVIARIKELRAKPTSLGAIADILNIDKIPSKKGGKWSAKTISDILDNSLNS